MTHFAFARSLPVFRALSDDELRSLLTDVEERRYLPGAHIIRRGESADCMFVLREGAVRVPIINGEGKQEHTVWLGPGDVFGEMAVVTGEPRGTDVFADGEIEVRCLVFARADVDSLLRAKPAVARFLTEIVGRRLLEGGQVREVGKYQVLREIGRGGVAIVYEGRHPTLGRSVAIKMLSHELVYEHDFAKRFLAEARLVAELRHQNIVQVYDQEQAYATFFIVMERLEGEELKALITRGDMTFGQIRDVLRETARGLKHAHERGIVHRDIKPSNLFLENTGRTKIMDFGIAGAPASDDDAGQGVVGTPGYIAPELLLGRGADHRADIYALGVVAYEMLAGHHPFHSDSQQQVLMKQLGSESLNVLLARPDAPDDLVAFVKRATAQEPSLRYASCDDILREFDSPMKTAASRPRSEDEFILTVRCDRRDRARVDELLAEAQGKLRRVPSVHVHSYTKSG